MFQTYFNGTLVNSFESAEEAREALLKSLDAEGHYAVMYGRMETYSIDWVKPKASEAEMAKADAAVPDAAPKVAPAGDTPTGTK